MNNETVSARRCYSIWKDALIVMVIEMIAKFRFLSTVLEIVTKMSQYLKLRAMSIV